MTIHIDGLTELLFKLKRIEQLNHVKNAMRAAALHIRGKIAHAPPVSRRPQPFKSDKQRRGFFYHLKHGDIDVPYQRGKSRGSYKLATSWTIESRNMGLTQVIGNNAPYGPLVQGPGKQTAYHAATGWQTTDQVLDKERDYVVQYIRDAAQREIDAG